MRELYAVWGRSSAEIYAVGSANVDAATRGVIFQSTGNGTWSPVSLGAASSAGSLLGIWGDACGEIYAVGDGGTILHRR